MRLPAQPIANENIVAAVAETASELGNTPAVCRSSYIHPGILAAAESGELSAMLSQLNHDGSPVAEMTQDEIKFVNLPAPA